MIQGAIFNVNGTGDKLKNPAGKGKAAVGVYSWR